MIYYLVNDTPDTNHDVFKMILVDVKSKISNNVKFAFRPKQIEMVDKNVIVRFISANNKEQLNLLAKTDIVRVSNIENLYKIIGG